MGLRVDNESFLGVVISVCEELDWPTLDENVVDAMVSLRFAPPSEGGRRYFNILYFGGHPVKRSLCRSEMLQTFREKLPVWARCRPLGMSLFSGWAIGSRESVIAVAGYPKDLVQRICTDSLASLGIEVFERSSFAVLENGSFHYPSGGVSELKQILVLSNGAKSELLSPGQAALALLGYSTTRLLDPGLALSAASRLAASVPVLSVGIEFKAFEGVIRRAWQRIGQRKGAS